MLMTEWAAAVKAAIAQKKAAQMSKETWFIDGVLADYPQEAFNFQLPKKYIPVVLAAIAEIYGESRWIEGMESATDPASRNEVKLTRAKQIAQSAQKSIFRLTAISQRPVRNSQAGGI